MYRTDVLGHIAPHMMNDPDYTFKVVKFTLHSIRRRFVQVNDDNVLMETQKLGLQYAAEFKRDIYSAIRSRLSLEEKLERMMRIPGINLTKAGFILQMAGEQVGCIDTWNLRFLEIKPDYFSIKKDRYNRNRVWEYIGACQSYEMGGAEKMWNNWCEFIADKYPKDFISAQHVSTWHIDKISEMSLVVND